MPIEDLTPLARLKLMVGVALSDTEQDALFDMLLGDAREWIAVYTGRLEWLDDWPNELIGVMVQWAAARYNRRGIEGTLKAEDGGIKRWVDSVPSEIKRVLNMYRRAKAVSLNALTSN